MEEEKFPPEEESVFPNRRTMFMGLGSDAVYFVPLSEEGMGQAISGDGGAAGAYEVGQDANSHKERTFAFSVRFF